MQTLKLSDATGDLLDGSGKPITAENYLDIAEAEVSIIGTNYRFRMKVNGQLPTKLDDTLVALEWDFFIDADNSRASGWNYSIAANDTGPDYLVSLNLKGSQADGMLLDILNNKYTKVASKITGDTLEVSFTWTLMQQIQSFDCVAAARKWVQSGSNQVLTVVDKTPAEGHYNMPKGYVYIQPGLPTASMVSTHAAIIFNQGNDDKAAWYGKAWEYAYSEIGKMLGAYPGQKYTLYIYRTQSDLVQGLQAYSQFNQSDASFFNSFGSPRPTGNMMHISPGFDWRSVIHLHVHAMMDTIVGTNIYRLIEWLDEGWADYLAYEILLESELKDSATTWHQSRVSVAKKALNENKWFKLSQISSSSDWQTTGTGLDLAYAESYMVVSYIVSKYGADKCIAVFKHVGAGNSVIAAVEKELGVTLDQLEAETKAYCSGL